MAASLAAPRSNGGEFVWIGGGKKGSLSRLDLSLSLSLFFSLSLRRILRIAHVVLTMSMHNPGTCMRIVHAHADSILACTHSIMDP